jgi:hypothetical protein
MEWEGLGVIHSAQNRDHHQGSCKHNTDLRNSIKRDEYLERLNSCLFSFNKYPKTGKLLNVTAQALTPAMVG